MSSNAEVRKVLVDARSILERGTCKGWFARTASGRECGQLNPAAVCWCPAGAIGKAVGAPSDDDWSWPREAQDAIDALRRQAGGVLIADWWDRPEISNVDLFALVDRAIESCDA